MNSKVFWIVRKYFLNAKFLLNKCRYRFHSWTESRKRETALTLLLFKTLVKNVIISSALVVLLYYADIALYSAVQWPEIPTSILVDIIVGGLGVAGVILGLYCSNVASIYSARYANAPSSVTSAFQNDVLTSACFKQISGYIVFCVILLFRCLTNVKLYYAATSLFLLFTVYIITAFTVIRNRTYQLADSYQIADNLYPIINSEIANVSSEHFRGSDPSFQNHAHNVCSKCLNTLKDIAVYNKGNPINHNLAMLSFMNNCCRRASLSENRRRCVSEAAEVIWRKQNRVKEWP